MAYRYTYRENIQIQKIKINKLLKNTISLYIDFVSSSHTKFLLILAFNLKFLSIFAITYNYLHLRGTEVAIIIYQPWFLQVGNSDEEEWLWLPVLYNILSCKVRV